MIPASPTALTVSAPARNNAGTTAKRIAKFIILFPNSPALCSTCRFLLSSCKAVCRRFCELTCQSLSFYPAARLERNRCRKFFHQCPSCPRRRSICRCRDPAIDHHVLLSDPETDPDLRV